MDQSMGVLSQLGQSSLQIRSGGVGVSRSPHFDSISAPQPSGAFLRLGWTALADRRSSRVLVESAVAVAPSPALPAPGTRPCGVHEARVKRAAVSAGKLRVPDTWPSRGTRSPIRAMLFSRRFLVGVAGKLKQISALWRHSLAVGMTLCWSRSRACPR